MAGSEAVREVVIGIRVVRLRTDPRGPLLKGIEYESGTGTSGFTEKAVVPRTKHNQGFDGPAPVAEKSVNLKIGTEGGAAQSRQQRSRRRKLGKGLVACVSDAAWHACTFSSPNDQVGAV
jgi:hypothetical protein